MSVALMTPRHQKTTLRLAQLRSKMTSSMSLFVVKYAMHGLLLGRSGVWFVSTFFYVHEHETPVDAVVGGRRLKKVG